MLLRLLISTMAIFLASVASADTATRVSQECGACHALEEPDFETLGITERLQRQAPPLYFAGNKYRVEWLEQWLQSPEQIFPAGYLPYAPVKTTPEGDIPDTEALHQHLVLDSDSAQEVAAYLMTLTGRQALVEGASYTPGNLAMRMGAMDFRRFKGCNACHQEVIGEGGLSGPLLHNAWQRLQPEYIDSFISDPSAWDPNTIMPRLEMNEAAVQKLVDYLRLIGEEQ